MIMIPMIFMYVYNTYSRGKEVHTTSRFSLITSNMNNSPPPPTTANVNLFSPYIQSIFKT